PPRTLDPTRVGDILAATHPSEHDAIADGHQWRPSPSVKAQSDRRRKVALRIDRDARRAAGVLSGIARKKVPDLTAYGHTMPFMIPVPYSTYGAVCAEHSGHIRSTSFGSMIAACANMPQPYVPPPPRAATAGSNEGNGGGTAAASSG
ncbi:hypothetical protein H0H87_010000, partial [Tephrocybe sp. NHM501043]